MMTKFKYILFSAVMLLLPFMATTAMSQPADSAKSEQLVQILTVPKAGPELSDSELHDRAEALRLLARLGNKEAVAAIVPFLADARLNTAARTALLNMDAPTVLPVLRKALQTEKGATLAGVIQMLGTLKDSPSASKIVTIIPAADPVVLESILATLGKMETKEADDALISVLDGSNVPVVRRQAAVALIHSADVLISAKKLSDAARLLMEIRDADLPDYLKGKADRLMLTMAKGEEDSDDFYADMIMSEDRDTFEMALGLLPVVLTWPADQQMNLLLNAETLSPAKQARIFVTLGAADLSKGSPKILKTACKTAFTAWSEDSSPSDLKNATLAFLVKAVPLARKELTPDETKQYYAPIIQSLATGNAEQLAVVIGALAAAKDSLTEKVIREQATNANPAVRKAVFDIIGKCRLASAVDLAKKGIADSDSGVRSLAYGAFAAASKPSAENMAFLLDQLGDGKNVTKFTPEESNALVDALLLIGKQTFEPAACAALVWKRFQSATTEIKCRYINILVQIGNADALKTIVQCALDTDDAVMDQATKVLGEWINLDAAPALLELAQKHPVEKYRIRAIRGYIRLVRQMGSDANQKVEMADKIAPFIQRNDEKKLLNDLYSAIEGTRKDKLLFDGKTFNGWEGDTAKTFRIQDGAIVAGTMKDRNPRNEFLCTKTRFRDFTLTLECKIMGEGGNAGIQFRSDRIPNHHEMIGYQADMTTDGKFWGMLYDESRRKKMLADVDPELIKKAYRPNEWNRYKIICWGNNVQVWLNDIMTVNYFEKEDVAKDGVIGLQIHGGPASEAWYRNIRIENYQLKSN